MATFYKSGAKWVVNQFTLESGSCYKVESADGLRLELKMFSDNKTVLYDLYTSVLNAAGGAYTKDQLNILLEDFLRTSYGVPGGCVAVTPHNTNLLPHVGWIEVRGTAGNVALVDAYGNASLVLAFETKELSKMLVSKVLSTGTTATGIYLYY